jgi:hypothetical protein
MLRLGWLSTIMMFSAAMAFAQTPSLNPAGQRPPNTPMTVPGGTTAPPAAPLNPTASRLDALLIEWEKSMKDVQTLVAPVRLTEVDDLTKTSEVYDGQIKFMRPNRADLYVAKSTNPQL